MSDPSRGYETAAAEYIEARNRSGVGAAVVRDRASALPAGASVLELECGNGVPISQALLDAGVSLFVIDASPRMIAAFKARFPKVPNECIVLTDEFEDEGENHYFLARKARS